MKAVKGYKIGGTPKEICAQITTLRLIAERTSHTNKVKAILEVLNG